jgi:hypothetical protein
MAGGRGNLRAGRAVFDAPEAPEPRAVLFIELSSAEAQHVPSAPRILHFMGGADPCVSGPYLH